MNLEKVIVELKDPKYRPPKKVIISSIPHKLEALTSVGNQTQVCPFILM